MNGKFIGPTGVLWCREDVWLNKPMICRPAAGAAKLPPSISEGTDTVLACCWFSEFVKQKANPFGATLRGVDSSTVRELRVSRARLVIHKRRHNTLKLSAGAISAGNGLCFYSTIAIRSLKIHGVVMKPCYQGETLLQVSLCCAPSPAELPQPKRWVMGAWCQAHLLDTHSMLLAATTASSNTSQRQSLPSCTHSKAMPMLHRPCRVLFACCLQHFRTKKASAKQPQPLYHLLVHATWQLLSCLLCCWPGCGRLVAP